MYHGIPVLLYEVLSSNRGPMLRLSIGILLKCLIYIGLFTSPSVARSQLRQEVVKTCLVEEFFLKFLILITLLSLI